MKLFLMLLFSSLPPGMCAQKNTPDSFYVAANKSKDDTVKATAFYYLAMYSLQLNDPDSAYYYNNKLSEISNRLNWYRGKMSSLNVRSKIFSSVGNYDKGLEALFEALKIAEKLKDIQVESAIYVSIAQLYNNANDFKEALLNYRKAFNLTEKLGRKIPAIQYSDFADAFNNLGSHDSALFYQNRALELSMAKNDKRTIAISYCNLGNIFSKLKKIAISNEYFLEGLRNAEAINFKMLLAEITLGLANNYQETNMPDSSLNYAIRALYYSQISGYIDKQIGAAVLLGNYYKKQKKYDSLSKYLDMQLILKDSFLNTAKSKKLEDLRITEKYRQEAITAREKKDKEYRRRSIQIGLIAVFIPLFAGFVYLLSSRKKKNVKIVSFLAIGTILMLFEFISLIVHPSVESVTNHNAILMYLILLMIAFLLAPIHHRLQNFIKRKL